MTFLSLEAVHRLRDVATWPELPPDRYVILRPIGRGGMGAVFAARDVRLDREVAVKVSNGVDRASPLDARLEQEARILASLEHPGIVPIHDAGVLDDGRAFYVMKLVRGETLTTAASRLDTESARLAVFERVVEAVGFAHAAGIVHRDIKPGNVMIGAFGEVLVLDWGLARSAATLQPEGRAGTPGFMAPEQRGGATASGARPTPDLKVRPPVGPAADVYALGALLFWLLTAAAPPDGREAIAAELRRTAVAPGVRLRAIVSKCLAADAGDRYPDAAALAGDLARYRADLPVIAHRDTWIERAIRMFATYRTFILLVLAYLVMRAILAWR
jgi:eukaryotic-like serine/threonine-protein kinase